MGSYGLYETTGRFVEGYLAWLMASNDSDDWSEAKHALATAWMRTIDALLAVLNWKSFGNFYRKARPELPETRHGGIHLEYPSFILILELAGPGRNRLGISKSCSKLRSEDARRSCSAKQGTHVQVFIHVLTWFAVPEKPAETTKFFQPGRKQHLVIEAL